MRLNCAVVAAMACVFAVSGLARGQSELVTQTQAADVLSDLITYTNTKADAREAAMKQFITDSGKEAAFAQFKLDPVASKPLAFSQVFQGAVQYVRNGGDKFANPAIKSMNDAQLSAELTELQVYNIQEFMKLDQKKKTIDTMRAYLTSTGEMEKYQKWSKDSTASLAPAVNADDVAARLDLTMKSAKAVAWKKAEARGVTEADFEAQWKKQVEQYKEGVTTKVDGVKSLAKSLSEPAPAAPAPQKFEPPAVAVYPQAPPPPSISAPSLPPTVQSGATNAMYQQQNNELWNRFDD